MNITMNFQQTSFGERRIRDAGSCGKIVKNKIRIQTEVSTESSIGSLLVSEKKDNFAQKLNETSIDLRPRKCSRYTLRSQNSLDNYESKLATYQKNKRDVLRDMGRIALNKKDFEAHPKTNEHFFTAKLKSSLNISLIKNQINKQNSILNQRVLSNSITRQHKREQKEDRALLQSRQHSSNNSSFQSEKKVFFWAVDQLVKAETNLRSLKSQICLKNRKQVKKVLSQLCDKQDQEIDALMKISYEQFEYPSGKQILSDSVSGQTLAQKLIQNYRQAQSIWKQMVFKKFNKEFVRQLYERINYEKKVEIDLKVLTRQLNLYSDRKYQTKQLFKLYQRASPLTKGNFLYNFTY